MLLSHWLRWLRHSSRRRPANTCDRPKRRGDQCDDQAAAPSPARRLTFEALEERRLLTATPLAGDFGTLGADSLVFGVPGEDIDGERDAGALHVLFGLSPGAAELAGEVPGITTTGNGSAFEGDTDFFGATVPGTATDRNLFGSAWTVGDFDDRTFDIDPSEGVFNIKTADLAISVPGKTVGNDAQAGEVVVFYTRPGQAPLQDRFSQDSSSVLNGSEPADRFGESLVSGDFNGDGVMDLAIGSPREDLGSVVDAGGVNVIYGDRNDGLDATSRTVFIDSVNTGILDDQFWSQGDDDLAGDAEAGDNFGAVLASGDFNGDGKDDLAIGIPGQDIGGMKDAGAVQILYGSQGIGLQDTVGQFTNQIFFQGGSTTLTHGTVQDTAEAGDRFGTTLATGDFDRDGFDDLAIGVPFEDDGSAIDAGAVHILYGGASFGLQAGDNGRNDDVFFQDSNGVGGTSEAGDLFGFSLAAGNFNLAYGSSTTINQEAQLSADLAIGAPGEDFGNLGIIDAGVVFVLDGSNSGLLGTSTARNNSRFFTQDSAGIDGDGAESFTYFGALVWAGDFDGSGVGQPVQHHDLAIGAPLEPIGSVPDAGGVHVLYSDFNGVGTTAYSITGANDQFFSQLLIGGNSETGDNAGGASPYPYFTIPKLVNPLEGTPFVDWTASRYLDLDAGSGAIDFQGETSFVSNGSRGIEYTLPSYSDMDAGVNAVAAAPGVVLRARDGFFDREIGERDDTLQNVVTIDHGNGWTTRYGSLQAGRQAGRQAAWWSKKARRWQRET